MRGDFPQKIATNSSGVCGDEMTQIFYKRNNNHFTIEISGHAGHSSKPDIVCAACSVLACTLLQCIKREEAAGIILRVDRCDVYDGDVKADFTVTAEHIDRLETVIETILEGYGLLEGKYPECVKIQ